MTRYRAVLLIALAACQTSTGSADDGPSQGVPELQALSNYVGTWDVDFTSANSPFTKGECTAKWILDGRFVQQTAHLVSADGNTSLKITTLMTYDQKERAYRMWSFISNGTTSESSGQWDPKNRTMTSINRDGDTTTTSTAKFPKDGIEEWTIVTTVESNQVVGEISGKNTRRK